MNYKKNFFACLIIIAFTGAGVMLWQAWPKLLLASMHWQKEINNQISDLLFDAQTHLFASGISLTVLCFIYGLLHSLGPGHGKMIVSTYVATHPTKVKISLMLTVVSSLLQAVVAIVLVSVLIMFFHSTMREVNNEATRFISLSFCAVILLGIIVIYRSIKAIIKAQFIKKKPFKINKLTHKHTDNVCSCGHVHFASAEDINNASSFKEYLAVIFSVGLRPCTGAILVLLFANMAGIYWLGILSAFVMSLGTALTTSIIAIMTLSGKKLIKRYLNTTHDTDQHVLVYSLLKLLGGIVLILLGVLLLLSQQVAVPPVF